MTHGLQAAENGRIARWMRDVFQQSRREPPRFGLRTSGLPYCPLLDLQAQAENAPGEWSYAADHYTRIGTAIHENLQRWAPDLNSDYEVWGNWRCTVCNRNYPDCVRPTACRCGRPVDAYIEYDFSSFPGIDSAHCDMLLRHRRTGHWTALDFKTTSYKLFHSAWYARYYPDKKHLLQIASYAALFWWQYRRRIRYVSIVYTARERPLEVDKKGNITANVRPYTFAYTRQLHRRTIDRLQRAVRGRAAIAGSATELYERRPCIRRLDYLNEMAPKFFGDEQCPHYADGSCFKAPQMIKKLTGWQATLAARRRTRRVK